MPGEAFLNVISDPNITVLLLVIGGVALLFESLHPGATVPGIVGVFSLVLAVLSAVMLPPPLVVLILVALAFVFVALVVASLRRGRPRPAARFGRAELIGHQAVTITPLDPSGYVLLDGERWAAHAVGGNVRTGERVVITEVQGLRLQVSPTRPGSEIAAEGSAFDDWLDRELGAVRSERQSGGE